MKKHILPAIRLTLFCLIFFCGVYTLIILGIAQAAPGKGLGEKFFVNKVFVNANYLLLFFCKKLNTTVPYQHRRLLKRILLLTGVLTSPSKKFRDSSKALCLKNSLYKTLNELGRNLFAYSLL